MRARYRARSLTRGPGHFDEERSEEELWGAHTSTPLGLGPLLEVDTSGEVDVSAAAAAVLAAAGQSQPPATGSAGRAASRSARSSGASIAGASALP